MANLTHMTCIIALVLPQHAGAPCPAAHLLRYAARLDHTKQVATTMAASMLTRLIRLRRLHTCYHNKILAFPRWTYNAALKMLICTLVVCKAASAVVLACSRASD